MTQSNNISFENILVDHYDVPIDITFHPPWQSKNNSDVPYQENRGLYQWKISSNSSRSFKKTNNRRNDWSLNTVTNQLIYLAL